MKAAVIRVTNLILSLKLAPTVKTPKIISHSGGEEFLAKHERLTADARLNLTYVLFNLYTQIKLLTINLCMTNSYHNLTCTGNT